GLGLALALLSACASPAAKIYTLAAQSGQKVAGRPVSVSIETVDVAKYLDRPQLVRRSGDVQLGVSEFERWGEPMGSMVQRVLAENLRRRLPAGSLVTTSQTVSGKEAATLELSVSRFDTNAEGVVMLQAQWRLHYRNGGRSAAAQASIAVPPADTGAPAQVEAMSSALDQLAGHIAAKLR
ncbi:membrane integrity-associated transporter subunit PqiC, partial [Labrys sp. KB_33_2]|uniref:PqiC family protein n=1 Tax=Labrys sp. KB_33_2 TaxID=3237479 RepID=UPI003F938B24